MAAPFSQRFKRREVNFPQGALIHNRIHRHAPGLLIIGGIVLDGSADPLALHTIDKGRRQFACQNRVFRKIFKIAAAKRRALDIHSRAQQNRHMLRLAFLPERFAKAARGALG